MTGRDQLYSAFTLEGSFTDTEQENETGCYLRARQKNNRRAWSSPIRIRV
ncbi:hypothetical protein ACFL6L_00065 [candidate division KSB1 bacterium]